ncbi:hypothetical protein AB6A40_007564 [Gnathostoma spinigerum]|uniref:Glucosylceramidase n=1 Tax=Gnathostoma spinigerum TaxID=75299 RepID=A0ABD6ELL0_9BILA
MCLDERGGPNWVANFVDAPVIVNGSNDEFYKQPMFYVMGHFSKFIRPASARISLSYPEQRNLRGIAFSTPDSRRVLVLLNTDHEKPLNITVEDAAMGGKTFDVTLETETIATIVWNKPPYSALRNRVALSFFNDRHFFIFLTCLEALDIVWSC